MASRVDAPTFCEIVFQNDVRPINENKIAVMMNHSWKYKGHEFVSGVDPEFAGTYRNPQRGQYTWGTAKWTSTLSNRLLLEAGYAFSTFDRNIDNEPWVDLPTLAVTLLLTQLGLLFWETKYVSATLAYPGLKPDVRKEK